MAMEPWAIGSDGGQKYWVKCFGRCRCRQTIRAHLLTNTVNCKRNMQCFLAYWNTNPTLPDSRTIHETSIWGHALNILLFSTSSFGILSTPILPQHVHHLPSNPLHSTPQLHHHLSTLLAWNFIYLWLFLQHLLGQNLPSNLVDSSYWTASLLTPCFTVIADPWISHLHLVSAPL